MGQSIVNYWVKTPNQYALEAVLNEWCLEQQIVDGPVERLGHALLSPSMNGWMVVIDEASEEQDLNQVQALGTRISGHLSAEVIAVIVHRGEVLLYFGFDDTGRVIDEYISEENYLDESESDIFFTTRPDAEWLAEISTEQMADEEMFLELLGNEGGLALAEDLLIEFGLLLGLKEDYIGLSYAEMLPFVGSESAKGFVHLVPSEIFER